ncbi:uncharacterized protein GGS22DRAFT_29576 [Annulohypoxylon maeteangense]|uniref:uncharacterized protein n=1 Tax=Annulohypoxylon maeteangense TaxID=1927788 RepID=UPI0020087FF1|nr:uncharacterized protein GGS22DRAFT_29576 [Annulohypoxylon maeteangense]KAI0883370.1 hypothetical protein GGS22DRAFT_29576 [Annulohypoxylon maeteangense]
MHQLPSFLILLLPLLSPTAAAKPSKAVLLSDVRSLTLRGDGAQTTHRRVSAIPQLKCVSAPAICRLHSIDMMRCTNQGSGYTAEDIQWSCSAPLPPELKLGSTDVICEGYSSPDDPYVLKGSCGVEYRLILTEAGEQKFPDVANGRGGWKWGGGGGDKGRDKDRRSGSSDPSAIAFVIIFALVCMWILYSACVAGNRDPTRPGPRRNNWGGFGGGFDPGFGPGGGGGGGWDDPSSYPRSSSTQNQGWRPGFWTGLAGGAAAGYAAGGRRNNQQERNSGYNWGAGPSSSSSGSSGSRSTSTARYESTGFGSTSRR